VILTDENGHQTEYTYDGLPAPGAQAQVGRVTEVVVYTGTLPTTAPYARTTYTYDPQDHLREVHQYDGAGVEIAPPVVITTNSLGQKVATGDPDMGTWTYTYDLNGNLATQTDARGVVITFTYDALNRLTGKSYSDGSPPVTYTYDQGENGLGRRTGMTDASGETTWTYDLLGQVLTETRTIAGGGTFQTGYTYDRLPAPGAQAQVGRVRTITYPDTHSGTGGEVITYTYDAQGLVEGLTTNLTETVYLAGAGYTPLDQPSYLALGNGLTVRYGYYDPAYDPSRASFRLRTIQTAGAGGPLQDLSYAYDDVGNLTQVWDTVHDTTWSYGYDPLNRLTEAERVVSGLPQVYAYGYDPLGNLTRKEGLTLDYTVPGSLPHAPGRVWDGSEVAADFTYDAAGNRATRIGNTGSITYTYDAENRLTQVVSGTQTTTFVYDGDGRRVKRVGPDGTVTLYLGDQYEVTLDGSSGGLDLSWTFDNDLEGWTKYDDGTSIVDVDHDDTEGDPDTGSLHIHAPGGDDGIWVKVVSPPVNDLITTGTSVSFNYKIDPPDGGNRLDIYITTTESGEVLLGQITLGDSVGEDWTPASFPLDNYVGETLTEISIGFSTTYWYQVEAWIDTIVVRDDDITKHYYANGRRIATRVDGVLYYTLSDHLGSTTLIADAQGNEVGRVAYDPWGQVLENTLPPNLTDRLFTGQRWDATIGLYDYRARFYDPWLGQFTQPDSLVPDPLNPQAWNRYAYVSNAPTNYVDPSGHCPLCFAAIGASLFAMGGAIHYTATHPGASFDRWEYLSEVVGWGAWGAVGGATAYMLPELVGYGLSAAGIDVIGTAVWLNRAGVSAYGLMRAGQWAYAWGTVLQYGGWPVVGIALLPRYGGGLTEEEMAEMSAIARASGRSIGITGRRGETRLGQARRYVAAKLYGKNKVDVPWLRLEKWRITGVSTGKHEVDIWIGGVESERLPAAIEMEMKSIFMKRGFIYHHLYPELDYYDYPRWLGNPPPGFLFKPTGEVERILYPWQVP